MELPTACRAGITIERGKGGEKLTDRGERYRIRSGDYRVIDSIDDETRLVEIGDQKDIDSGHAVQKSPPTLHGGRV
jgi:hypothetical protein